MKIFALETDTEKLKRQCMSDGEQEVLMTYYHALSFLFASIREIFVTITIFLVGIAFWYFKAPMLWVTIILFFVWFFFVFFNLMKAWIDWRYDFILVTTDKLILVDQTSIFHQKINPIHLENIGSISAETQYMNLFGFGKIVVNLKEGEGGQSITLTFVPNADQVAAKISQTVTYYQRYVDGGGTMPHVQTNLRPPAEPSAASDSPPSEAPNPQQQQ